MDRSKVKFNWQNSIIYFFGILIVALGVVLLFRSDLGAGPWDTVTYSLSNITGTSLGVTSIMITSFLTLFVIAYRKNFKFLIMIIPIFSIGLAIDFWDILVFRDFETDFLQLQLILFVGGFFTIIFGLSIVIITKYPAFVFDELMLMIMEISGINDMRIVRIGVELFAIMLALIFGYIGGDLMGEINYGTVIIGLSVGFVLKYFLQALTSFQEIEDKIGFIFKHTINLVYYVVGAVLIAFGVVLLLRSGLGVSSWDTLHNSLSELFHFSFGTATILVALTTTAYVTYKNWDLKYLLMVIPIVFVGGLIDLFNDYIILNDFEPIGSTRFISFTIGLLFLPIGGSMLIVSTYPAGVFDELMLTLMKVFKTKNLFMVRVIMEFTTVLIALILGLIAGIGIGEISYGTVIFSISIGYLVKLNLKFYAKMGRYSFEDKN